MEPLAVDIRLDGIEINGRLYAYPVLLDDLAELFDEEPMTIDASSSARISAMWMWLDSGVSATHKDGVRAGGVTFKLKKVPHVVRIEGRELGEHFAPTGPTYPSFDFGNGFVIARRSDPGPEQQVIEITVEQKLPRQARTKKAAPKQPAPAAVVDAADFADLNFKLLVVQVLMYEKELLTPKFSVNEFVDNFTGRNIDLDEEAYEPIPEVLEYFENLAVPTSLLEHVDSIYQDGGNEIYMEIAPLWSGEDDSFDVTDFSDVALLPNITSMTLLGEDDEALQPLRDRGIEAELL